MRKAEHLPTFTADIASALGGPDWLRERRLEGFEAFSKQDLPSEAEEVWRYSPIDSLDLESYRPSVVEDGLGPADQSLVDELVGQILERAALCIVRDGSIVSIERGDLPEGVTIEAARAEGSLQPSIGQVVEGGDALVRLNDAFAPDVLSVVVPVGTVVSRPIVVVHLCTAGGDPAPAAFPRTVVRAERGSECSVVEIVAPSGPGRSLVVPVAELLADEGSHLSFVSLQLLGDEAWYLGRIGARIERDAALRAFTVGLGGAYDRCRTDAAVVGQGATSELRSAYLGTGEQIHDVRTLQDHAAPRTDSDLLCKGAVAGSSRSVYSGLIRIRHGAVRSNAMQTNHNLVLDERAHADSVPNLEIEENDVRCSHASTVGPVDEDQLYYLESRGVAPDRAERLIVSGFFADIVAKAPVPAVVPLLQHEVAARLAATLDEVVPTGGEDHHG